MLMRTHSCEDIGQLTRRLELDSLRLLAVVCAEGSYAKAAHVEPLTASAISKRIAELERAMGCVLLERSSYGVRPTKAGELVLAQWAEVAASLSGLMAASDALSVVERVQLSVVADAESARFLLFDCLAHVDALDDAARVGVTRAQLAWLPIEFQKLAAHAAVWSLDEATGDERRLRVAQSLAAKFERCRLFAFSSEVCVAAVRHDHPLATLGLVSAEDLEPYELVYGAGTHAWRTRGAPPAAAAAQPTWSHQVGTSLEYLDSVPSGVVAVLPTSARYLVHRFPMVRCLTLTEEHGCRRFGCALRDDAWLDDRARLLERLTGCTLETVASREAEDTDSSWAALPAPAAALGVGVGVGAGSPFGSGAGLA